MSVKYPESHVRMGLHRDQVAGRNPVELPLRPRHVRTHDPAHGFPYFLPVGDVLFRQPEGVRVMLRHVLAELDHRFTFTRLPSGPGIFSQDRPTLLSASMIVLTCLPVVGPYPASGISHLPSTCTTMGVS